MSIKYLLKPPQLQFGLKTYNLYINIYFLHCQLLLLWVPLWHDAAETQTHRKWSNPFLWHSLRHNSWSWGEASVAPHLSRNRHSSHGSKHLPEYNHLMHFPQVLFQASVLFHLEWKKTVQTFEPYNSNLCWKPIFQFTNNLHCSQVLELST